MHSYQYSIDKLIVDKKSNVCYTEIQVNNQSIGNTIMFQASYKRNNAYESWVNIGSYNSEQAAISAALQYKNKGVLMVRVTKSGAVIYSN